MENFRTEKKETVEYSEDEPVKEKEEDGTVNEYTYYTKADGEGLDGLVKTSKETDGNGDVVGDEFFKYDSDGNVIMNIDYAAGTKEVKTYVGEGEFKGELETEKEYLITSSNRQITKEILQSDTTYTYRYTGEGRARKKLETCRQTIPAGESGSETIMVSTEYDVMGRELSETDSRGYVTESRYDGFGRNHRKHIQIRRERDK